MDQEVRDSLTASNFISKLVDDGICQQAFFDSTFDKDFILLAEFCELEGPKPIFTIPETLHSTFNLNTFAVRIMSVDCVSIMQATDFSNFTVAGDIQVVLTEMSEGAVAYVHHFVLYDICARGFVRPFCLAYITKHHSDLMLILDKLQSVFSFVSLLFHFGNALSFMNDIMLRLQHLMHLKNVLTEKVCDVFVDDVMLTETQKKSITTQALEEAMCQLKGLMQKFMLYVQEEKFEEHRELFSPRYLDMMQKVKSQPKFPNDGSKSSKDGGEKVASTTIHGRLVQESTHHIPHVMSQNTTSQNKQSRKKPSHRIPSDVISSILGKKYDKRLRSLNELCDVTCNAGLDMMKYFLHMFTTKEASLIQKDLFVVQPSIIDQAAVINVGTMEFPVISRFPDEMQCCTEDKNTFHSLSMKTFLRHFINLENNSTFLSATEQRGMTSLNGVAHQPESLNPSFLSLLKYTSISLPAVSSSAISTQSKVGSFVNIPSVVGTSPVNISGQSGESNTSTESFEDALPYQESVKTNSSNNSTDGMTMVDPRFARSISGMSSESVVSADGVKEKAKAIKVPLLKLRNMYSFLPHVVYSLFIGRPLIVIGDEKDARSISTLVYAFANFLPSNSMFPKKVFPWMTRKLSLSDLRNIGIAGMPKVNETNPVPLSLRCYVSLVDYNLQTLHAPSYDGESLFTMFDTTKQFNETTFRKFIGQIWSEFVSAAYVRFSAHYTETDPYRIANAANIRHMDSMNLSGGKTSACDVEILMYFIDTLKKQILRAFDDSDTWSHTNFTFKLNNRKCQTIPNMNRRKK